MIYPQFMKIVWRFLKITSGFLSLKNLMDIVKKVGLEFTCSFYDERDKWVSSPSESLKRLLHKSLGYLNREKITLRQQFKDKSLTPFISRSTTTSVDWTKRIPRSWLIHPCEEITDIIKKFVTCEGRFNILYLYHIKLMQHLKNDCEINMP